MTKLREFALEYGPDVRSWPEVCQREAVVELFQQDEGKGNRYPDWLPDALSEFACEAKSRAEVIRILQIDNAAVRQQQLGALVESALFDYPLDSLAIECVERLPDWRAADREAAA